MRKYAKILSTILIVVLLAVSFAGCGKEQSGGSAENGGNSESNGNEQGGGSTETSGGVKKITWSTWGSIEENEKFAEFTDAFNEKHKGEIEAEFLPIPTGYGDKMATQVAGGSAPDVFYFGSELSPSMIYNGKLEDLTPYLEKSETLTYDMFANEKMGTLAEYDGGIYGLCPDDNPMVLYYNANLFKEAGLKTPTEYWEAGEWTLEKYIECMTAIRDNNKDAGVPRYGAFLPINWRTVLMFLNYYGEDMFSEDNTSCVFNTDKAKEAIGVIKQLVDDEIILTNVAEDEANPISDSALFMSGQVATVFSGRWLTPTFKQIEDFEWDIIPFPTPEGDGLYAITPGYTYVVMNADSKEKDASWTFIEEFVNEEGQLFRLADGGNATASIKGVNEKILTGGVPKSELMWIDLAEISTWTPLNVAKYPEANDMIMDGIKEIMLGAKDLNTGLDEIAQNVNAYLSEVPY